MYGNSEYVFCARVFAIWSSCHDEILSWGFPYLFKKFRLRLLSQDMWIMRLFDVSNRSDASHIITGRKVAFPSALGGLLQQCRNNLGLWCRQIRLCRCGICIIIETVIWWEFRVNCCTFWQKHVWKIQLVYIDVHMIWAIYSLFFNKSYEIHFFFIYI